MYEDTCEILCLDTNISNTGEILDFKPNKKIVVSINRAIQISLWYVESKKKYIGNSSGLEFITDGPKEGAEYKNRTRDRY
jgi:hypothetical protein